MADKPKKTHFNERIKLSIILKLNARLFLQTFLTFVFFNIILFAAVSVAMVFYAEQPLAASIGQIKNSGLPDNVSAEWLKTQGITVSRLKTPLKGFTVPPIIQNMLPKLTRDDSHCFTFPNDKGMTDWQKFSRMTYSVGFSYKDAPYQISICLSGIMQLFVDIFTALFIIEAFILLRSLFSNARVIRRTLRPIAELAAAAENLNKVAFSTENTDSLAGELNHINAAKLDTRIPVDGVQRELRTLAVSINDLLDRINEAYRSQVQFVSDASHELRTPIAVIQGYASLLDRWGKNDEKTMQESITAIKEETANMKQLVEQLLFLARGDNNSIRLAPEKFDLQDLAHELITETQMIDVGHEYTEKAVPAVVMADKALLKQCARILMDNAIKYTPPGGHIIASVYQNGGLAFFSIQDDGIGIPAEAVPKIFDRFFRAEESRARATGGTGLGLSIAKWIIERHGGHMEVLSRENIGTRISVALPLLKIESDINDSKE